MMSGRATGVSHVVVVVVVVNTTVTRQDKTRYISDRTGYGFRNTFIYIYM